MEYVPNVREILLDEEIDEQEFVNTFNKFYKQGCYIYAIIPEYEQELLEELASDFNELNKFPLPRVFPREIGHLGYVKDNLNKYIFEFYLRSTTMDHLVFSETDATELLKNINKKNVHIYKLFEINRISHITIGPDGQWLNVVEY
ncbi:hypothetical protein ACFWM3_14110 [Gottfriedia sp. NPDC058432]|uniref:hypothetical protein n=1 Tax=Gottfriedia sp. NPDC058432 TaxID=3346497 RepID=UPI00365A9BE0